MTPEKLEQQESLLKIHNSSYSHARSKSNLSSVGPWIRDNFPLLKIEEKPKEFFIRIDKWTIKRYFVDMENKLRCNDDFFYPSDKAIKELTISSRTPVIDIANNNYCRVVQVLFMLLIVNLHLNEKLLR